jgi:hypothetical protein
MNNRRDIEGQIDKALRAIKDVSDDEQFEDIIEIFSCDNIDDKSLHSRAFNKEKKSQTVTQIPYVSDDEVKEEFDSIFEEDEYSQDKINLYISSLLNGADKVSTTEINVNTMDDFIKLIMAQIYSEYDEMIYTLEYDGNEQHLFGYTMESFEIIRREVE